MNRPIVNNGRPAFSMIELIFVIVVLGIVASLGSELIAKVYRSYILQRALHRAETKTELAALEIANRLAAAIPGTVVRKQSNTSTSYEYLDAPMSYSGTSYNVLQWVGADIDSFNRYKSSTQKVGWSGLIDVNNTANTATNLVTPGSDLSLANTVISNLNGGALPAGWSPVIFFPHDTTGYDLTTPLSGNTLSLQGGGAGHIVEHYKLAWTSYALSVENGDLYLYYGFDPKVGWTIPSNTKKSLLLHNVSTFKFKGDGRTIRFKICKSENIGDSDFNVTACKEKAVF
ncbi:type II secretion system protein [Nitratifractor sp.]|uniref:type II secretion system protein n=1 Tax=Nitratifractor sp. TaxID=2268144 RepID=UPI0025D6132A|nr:prepilin-type N-terminal cleavage/methylation domain-containing protein [Nitratifractor sp.]